MNNYKLPFSLKICYTFFFINGAIGMLYCIVIWFQKDMSQTNKLLLFIFRILYFILNIEIGKGLKKLKKWSFIVAISLCVLQTIIVLFKYEYFSLYSIGAIIVMTLLFIEKKYYLTKVDGNYENMDQHIT